MIVAAILVQALATDSGRALAHRNGRIPRTVTAVAVDRAPTIDGQLDDEAWRRSAPTSEFRRDDPSDGAAPAHQTEVRLGYDRDALYIAARMYDDRPDLVSRRLSRRDSYDTINDLFAVLIAFSPGC